MRKLTKYTLTVMVCIAMASAANAAPAGWEQVKTEQVANAKSVMKDTELEIKASPGAISVTSTKQVQIKVFTILGRLVSSETLPSGTSRLQLPTHGVYIVKVGDLTCKVAV